ncbi:TIR domain-containing protein [Actinosynnema sp. NPDC047251]|uniref:TIR domain-containing protein n=1 Tax=Saccharothrix espanaensis (strain ATCC 51144 / DSM 44229 / JCM 9112 / NBRC 15066 / NRRL 15764) TaxID=1179773 RepID=K0JYM5_SACES|nr:TIR domain-containing protein [Saccharothrix espanaensis]CCH30397.1 hypothetical protein BN6_30920 [Saccharothrix espanaensis DSM 44229]
MAPLGVFLGYSSGLGTSALVEAARTVVADFGGVALEPGASPDLPLTEQCRRMIRESDLYVGVLGSAYGPELPDEPVSYAEFEYRTAVEIGVPRVVFLLADDRSSDRRQREFREFVVATAPTTEVASARELADALTPALDGVADRSGRRARRPLLVLHCGGAVGLAEAVAAALGVPARPVADPDVRSFVDGTESALILHHGGPLTPPESFGVGYALGHLGRRALVLTTGPVGMLAGLGVPVQPWSGEAGEAADLARSALGQGDERLPNCYISYAREDAPFVRRLRDDLADAGFSTWTESANIRAGEWFPESINAALDRADSFVVVQSRHSADSQWIEYEIRQALTPRAERRVVPVLVDPDPGVVHPLLRARTAVDFTGWSDETRYRRALRRLVRGLAIRSGVDR